ncbi:EcsC family protein [Halalkalibacter urbisdiaboli]|uniref:EcsC family protein n=1 Tax=Halalkalibacter urbisdiaboli TaxID=1960589 RepID=UPI000B438007|nr:EcsC family protein [Halalkalibacter urbisdiaboli]
MEDYRNRIAQIEHWEDQFFYHEATDAEFTYLKWADWVFSKLSPSKQERVLTQLESMIIHIQAWMQNSKSHEETRNRILRHARVFNPDIETIADLQVLTLEQQEFMAEQLMAKQRLLALGQGGLSGMGGAFLFAMDLPAVVAINIRSIQQLALVYGYDLNQPVEMIFALKLFHVATLPKAFQAEAWEQLFEEVDMHEHNDMFYQGKDDIIEVEWLQRVVRQVGKNVVIAMLRKKLIQGVPLIGMAFGATMNYRFSQQVIEVAHMFYQKRLILEKED